MSQFAKLFMTMTGKRGGPIKGESRVKRYEDQIEIDDWVWELGLDAAAAKGAADKAVPSVLSFGKLMDRASSGMLAAMKTGDDLDVRVVLEEGAQEQFQLVMDLKQGRLIKYGMTVKSEEKTALIDETWILDYRSIEFKYRVSANDGEISTGKLLRLAGASTEPPKNQTVAREQILKLSASFSPDQLEELWKQMKDESAKRTLTAGSTGTTLDA